MDFWSHGSITVTMDILSFTSVKINKYVRIQSILNLLDIISKFGTGTMFANLHLQMAFHT
jgi:hypothetical protein